MEDENFQKNRIEIFKYNALLSIIFFLLSSIYFGQKIENYSFSQYTISAMSKFLDEKNLSYFNITFFIKSFLDLGFAYYVFKYFKIKLFSITGFFWILAVLSFGLLGFFPSSQYQFIHIFIVGILLASWIVSEYLLAKLTNDEKFIYLTNNLLVIQIVSIFLFVFTNNFNGVIEIFYMAMIFFWLTNFIRNYLK